MSLRTSLFWEFNTNIAQISLKPLLSAVCKENVQWETLHSKWQIYHKRVFAQWTFQYLRKRWRVKNSHFPTQIQGEPRKSYNRNKVRQSNEKGLNSEQRMRPRTKLPILSRLSRRSSSQFLRSTTLRQIRGISWRRGKKFCRGKIPTMNRPARMPKVD